MAKGNEYNTSYGNAISRVYDDSRATLAVDAEGNVYKNLAASSTTAVSNAKGVLAGLSLNTNGGTVTIYDSLTASGTKIATIATDAPEGFYPFNVVFLTGLTIVTGATVDATVCFRPATITISSGSASRSTSPSMSPSGSASPSASVSPSASSSASLSPSSSASASASKSLSPSASLSPSSSASKSKSPSVSPSGSSSPSASLSPSASPSGMI